MAPDSTKSHSNPYTERINSYAEEHFHGREADLRLLETGLSGPTTRSFALVGGPKIGKTALLLQFRARQQRFVGASQRTSTPIVYVDCHKRSPDEILARIAAELVAHLGPDPSGDLAELQRLLAVRSADDDASALRSMLVRAVRALDRGGIQPVLCLNHFGRLDLDSAAVSLSLRDLSASASFVIALEPDELEAVQINSPFVNMIFVRRIGLLPFYEAAELINAPLAPEAAWNDAETEAIYWIAGGNPYLLTLVCEELYTQRLRGSSVLTPQLLRKDERIVQDVETLPAIRLLFGPIWASLSREAREILALTAHQTDAKRGAPSVVDDRYRDHQVVGELRDWGLVDVDKDSGNLVLCSRLFVRFVRSQEPPPSTLSSLSSLAQELDILERTLRGSNEGQLLRILRENNGTVVSLDELRRAIWGESQEGSRHVVDQTLSRLRKRLRANISNGDELIKGVRGQGYTLVLPE